MTWDREEVAEWKEMMDARRARERIDRPDPRCPKCNEKVIITVDQNLLAKDGDVIEHECRRCSEPLVITVTYPAPLYSTYVKKYLEE